MLINVVYLVVLIPVKLNQVLSVTTALFSSRCFIAKNVSLLHSVANKPALRSYLRCSFRDCIRIFSKSISTKIFVYLNLYCSELNREKIIAIGVKGNLSDLDIRESVKLLEI